MSLQKLKSQEVCT